MKNQLDNLGFRGYKRLIVVEFYSGSNVNDIGFSATVYVMDVYNKSIQARVSTQQSIIFDFFFVSLEDLNDLSLFFFLLQIEAQTLNH